MDSNKKKAAQIDALHWLSILGMRFLYWRLPSWVERLSYVPALNYGYKSGEGEPSFSPPGTENRVQLRLYHRVAGLFLAEYGFAHPVRVAEVGSGLGVGAAWLSSFLGDKLSVLFGVDQSGAAAAFCKRKYARDPKLSFRRGDAMHLPFPDESLDAVVNVESSHMYPDMRRFLQEVRRVLKPGGVLLWADFREAHKKNETLAAFEEAFSILEQEDISEGVLRALESREEEERKEEYVKQLLHSLSLPERAAMRLSLKYVRNFMGMKGSGVLEYFQARKLVYLRVAAQKAAS